MFLSLENLFVYFFLTKNGTRMLWLTIQRILPFTRPLYAWFVTIALPGWGKRNPLIVGKYLSRFLRTFFSSLCWLLLIFNKTIIISNVLISFKLLQYHVNMHTLDCINDVPLVSCEYKHFHHLFHRYVHKENPNLVSKI